MTVRCELHDCQANRICVSFAYDPNDVANVKRVAGASWVKSKKHWHVPLDMMSCRKLREVFGDRLHIGPALRSWATEAVREEGHLGKLALADTATLTYLPTALPWLYRHMHVGPIGLTFTTQEEWDAALAGLPSFQCADIRFLADSKAPLNANQQGLGKTPEWIGAVWEAGIEIGDHLVVCNAKAVDGTWEPELEKWQGDAPWDVSIHACTGNRRERQEILDEFFASPAKVRWLVVNTEMIRWVKTEMGPQIVKLKGKAADSPSACDCDATPDPHQHYDYSYPEINAHTWRTICVDECHKGSIRNDKSITHRSMDALKYHDKRTALSGTPAKKKGADVWGTLHWLRPDAFPSKFRFAMEFFQSSNNGYGWKFGELLEHKQDDFAMALVPYVLRRTKDECLPWLPPKHHIYVPCKMEGKQLTQYAKMEEDGFVTIGGVEVDTTSILAEHTRLWQFANAYCEMRDGVVTPTEHSCKLDAMLEKMDEADVFDDPDQKQIVFSQSRKMIEMAAAVLARKGVKLEIISGATHKRKGELRTTIEAFQRGDTQIMCIVTQAGGVSLTLDRADTAHFLDEAWAPDDTEQAEDRLHRATSGTKQVTVYHYYAEGTVDEYRQLVADGKRTAHEIMWDIRRKRMKEKAA